MGVCLGLIGSIFQMRRLNDKEIRALSWDIWGLFVRTRTPLELHEVNEGVHWEDMGSSANSEGF